MSDFQQYIDIKFTQSVYDLMQQANRILAHYSRRGMRMTVRQLYYQLVSKDMIPNTIRSYKRLVKILTDGRMAGCVDWDGIEDRARSFERRQHWGSGKDFARAAARSYFRDMWQGQDYRVFVLIEKDALSGVLSNVCYDYDVPLLACRGYASATVLRDFGTTDLRYAVAEGQQAIVLHLGDHDPSGIDMTRDIEERLALFLEIEEPQINRLALNMPQIERLKPPPNPAKQTDARYGKYVRRFGRKCWELDAIEPEELQKLVRDAIRRRIDFDLWERRKAEIAAMVKRLEKHAAKFRG